MSSASDGVTKLWLFEFLERNNAADTWIKQRHCSLSFVPHAPQAISQQTWSSWRHCSNTRIGQLVRAATDLSSSSSSSSSSSCSSLLPSCPPQSFGHACDTTLTDEDSVR